MVKKAHENMQNKYFKVFISSFCAFASEHFRMVHSQSRIFKMIN